MLQLRPNVAVLDDEPEMRKALRRLLLTHGFQVQVYAGAKELLVSLSAGSPDCLVLDLHMTGSNGFDVLVAFTCRRIDTPVVVITGHDEPDTEARVLSLGAVAYLTKPVDECALLSAIQTAIARPPAQPGSLNSPEPGQHVPPGCRDPI